MLLFFFIFFLLNPLTLSHSASPQDNQLWIFKLFINGSVLLVRGECVYGGWMPWYGGW